MRWSSWCGVLVFVAWCLAPIAGDPRSLVLSPYGGADPQLQMGLVQWSCDHWYRPGAWLDLPIFHPSPGMLGCMDSLLGQAWLVWPIHAWFAPGAPALYNLALTASLLLAALAMALLWRAAGGPARTDGLAALAMIAAPFTLTQLGHLNQLPPPFVLTALAATLVAVRRAGEGLRARRWWWLVAASVALQATWGWYGTAYAGIGVLTLAIVGVAQATRDGTPLRPMLRSTAREALLPGVFAAAMLFVVAQPQMRLADRHSTFTREVEQVRVGSADIQHLFSRGTYARTIDDWSGHGERDPGRFQSRSRPALNPGWITVALALVGWRHRRVLDPRQRRAGAALLVMGGVGLVLAFGDSIGLPFTDRRLPLPLEALRSAVPPLRAYRAVWRFGWLFVVAAAWWAAHGAWVIGTWRGRRRHLAPVAVVLLVFGSVPGGIPVFAAPYDGRPMVSPLPAPPGPVLTLPAPADEYAEDWLEAAWLVRAQELGRPVTGGATGWVPPEVVAFRERLARCESGEDDAREFLAEMHARGYVLAEVLTRPGDQERAAFWAERLTEAGAQLLREDPVRGLRTYRLEPAAAEESTQP